MDSRMRKIYSQGLNKGSQGIINWWDILLAWTAGWKWSSPIDWIHSAIQNSQRVTDYNSWGRPESTMTEILSL